MYYVERIERDQAAQIYASHMGRHFPKEEIKPLESIFRMWDMGAYFGLAMYEDSQPKDLAGYGFFAVAPGKDMLLLDYFAIVEGRRGQGIGSLFLKEMKEKLTAYKGILIETEDVEFARNQEERLVRQKRDAFYQRNGAVETGVKSQVYGVNYAIWDYPLRERSSREDCRHGLEELYKWLVPGEKYEAYVKIWG